MCNNKEYIPEADFRACVTVSSPFAKEFTLDIPRIPSIELPLKVSPCQFSVEKAINMCGGLKKVKKALVGQNNANDGLELHLNHGKNLDGSSVFFNEHPIIGKKVRQKDESIILKISLPKGTLGKYNGDIRKAIEAVDSKKLKIIPVAIIDNTIRFREMSDFQMILDNVPSARDFKNSFGTLDWKNFKNYVKSISDYDSRPFENVNNIVIDRSVQCPGIDFQLPPIPRFSMVNIPYLYKYRSNPYATKTSSGEFKVKGSYIKNYQQLVHDFDHNTKIPTLPHQGILETYQESQKTKTYPSNRSDSQIYEKLEKCLSLLRDLFDRRPIWVKRHIDGIIPLELQSVLKIALALLSYRFTKGPWRNTYIKLGIDPRSSNEYAKYQTEYFKIERKLLKNPHLVKNLPSPPERFYESNIPGDIDSRFKFNGKQIPWYLMLQIDLLIEEPNINEIYSNLTYLDNATELTGWFTELDLAKIRRIVKYELGCMVQGNYNFNEHKLKFFKVMLFAKESMLVENKDSEGDTNMEKISDDIIDDNGIETGEIDDTVLESEEADENYNDNEQKLIDNKEKDRLDNFDINLASFKDIIDRISKQNLEMADHLNNNLDGIVNVSRFC